MTALTHWVVDYPWDFAAITNDLDDYDKGWAYTDDDVPSGEIPKKRQASVASSKDEALPDIGGLDLKQNYTHSIDGSFTRCSNMSNVTAASKDSASEASSVPYWTMERAQQRASLLKINPSMSLKDSWKTFDQIDVDEFAHQITRMDWLLYHTFRGREILRHVSTPADQAEVHVKQMVDAFNHLANFVASMILYPDKLKHRVKTMEKFFKLAAELRTLNNYNSCGAITAGLENSSVCRLQETKTLTNPDERKAYNSVSVLVGRAKSFSAYRLAFQNTYAQKIALLPVHISDIVRTEAGNPTFVGKNRDRINWKKFELMGDMIMEVQQSQENPSSFDDHPSKP
ncbi:hypothetical protein KEM55_008623, partial [Ascosphaera atra]